MGITSTYVENTVLNETPKEKVWDHLHIRGEYISCKQQLDGHSGSPPHTWRILIYFLFVAVCSGITSTYVENTDTSFSEETILEDHLHIRGEYSSILLSHLPLRRITSTYVENTLRSL